MSTNAAFDSGAQARFQARIAEALDWPVRSTLTFPNTASHLAILREVHNALSPTNDALPAKPTLDEWSTKAYITAGGDGVLLDIFSGDPGFGQIEIDTYVLLVGDAVCVRTWDRDDERCPPPATTDFELHARNPEDLGRIVDLIVAWHQAHGVVTTSQR